MELTLADRGKEMTSIKVSNKTKKERNKKKTRNPPPEKISTHCDEHVVVTSSKKYGGRRKLTLTDKGKEMRIIKVSNQTNKQGIHLWKCFSTHCNVQL